jgi:hypothetical protein
VGLYSATTINPEILETVLLSLLPTKLNLCIAGFLTSHTTYYILKSDFLVIRLPCMRKDGIAGYLVADESRQAEAAVSIGFEKTHIEG